jgi:hypothetical protein
MALLTFEGAVKDLWFPQSGILYFHIFSVEVSTFNY